MTVSAGGKYVYNVPFRMEGKSLIVNVKVDGRPCEMIFDTGADLSMFTQRQIRELNLHPENTGQSVHMGGISGRMVAPLLRFADVQLGPISQPMLCTVSDLAALPRPLLGQNFYKDYPFTIDHSSGVIRFEKK
jgi:predicted aspartyl protease